jgi:copper chaperone CopZ
LRRNPKLASEVLTAMGAWPGVQSVEINTVTGSVLVHHDSRRLSSARVLAALARYGVRPAPGSARSTLGVPERASLGRAAERVITSVLERVVERSLLKLLPMLMLL